MSLAKILNTFSVIIIFLIYIISCRTRRNTHSSPSKSKFGNTCIITCFNTKISFCKSSICYVICLWRNRRAFWNATFWLRISKSTNWTNIIANLICSIELIKIWWIYSDRSIETLSKTIVICPSSIRSSNWTFLITYTTIMKH